MEDVDILRGFEKIIKGSGLNCSLESGGENSPLSRLIVYLGHDAQERERILFISVQQQNLADVLRKQPTAKKFIRTQFEVAFPFEVKDAALFDTLSLLAYLNRSSELPGFEMDETSGKVFFRYVLIAAHEEAEQEILLGIMGVIMLLMDIYGEAIEKIAMGEMSFDKLMQDVLNVIIASRQ